MVVGHNPTITELSNALTKTGADAIESIPTCGIVALEFATASWIKLRKNTGKRVFFDYPKNS
jgi:phosphohistidine phosphatase